VGQDQALVLLLLLTRSIDDDVLLAVMASQLDHIPLPLVSLTTTIQQQKAHASIGGNYANGYDHSKRDAFNGVVEQCPDMGVIYCSGYRTGYAVTAAVLGALQR
jgi:hypothetical protein